MCLMCAVHIRANSDKGGKKEANVPSSVDKKQNKTEETCSSAMNHKYLTIIHVEVSVVLCVLRQQTILLEGVAPVHCTLALSHLHCPTQVTSSNGKISVKNLNYADHIR